MKPTRTLRNRLLATLLIAISLIADAQMRHVKPIRHKAYNFSSIVSPKETKTPPIYKTPASDALRLSIVQGGDPEVGVTCKWMSSSKLSEEDYPKPYYEPFLTPVLSSRADWYKIAIDFYGKTIEGWVKKSDCKTLRVLPLSSATLSDNGFTVVKNGSYKNFTFRVDYPDAGTDFKEIAIGQIIDNRVIETKTVTAEIFLNITGLNYDELAETGHIPSSALSDNRIRKLLAKASEAGTTPLVWVLTAEGLTPLILPQIPESNS